MKRGLCLVNVIALVLICVSTAFANDWTAITDEVDVDFSTNTVRVYSVVGRKGSNHWDRSKAQARKTLLAYIDTLTTGKERVLLKDEFAKRKALHAKVQHLIEINLQNGQDAVLTETDQYSRYYSFDLKLLASLLPNLNFPTAEDAL